jgi:signal transduction histidine kinase
MQSIKFKILSAFMVVISILVVSEVFFVVMHFVLIKKYQDITDNMISEYQVIENTSNLINSFNNLIKYANDKTRIDAYNGTRASLVNLLAKLNTTITNPASQIDFLGLKNTVNLVLTDCDNGVTDVFQGDFVDITSNYDAALHQNYFVQQDTGTLILDEIKYTESLRASIVRTQTLIEIFGVIFFLVVLIGCVWYVLSFSRRLISPLIRLTKVAKIIQSGNLNAVAEKDLTQGTDEIASLANSFNSMVDSLKANIRQLRRYNETLIRTKKIVVDRETRINQLQEINRIKDEFMNIVTHELKTPLIPIVGLSEVMSQQKNNLTPEFQSYVDIIHKEAEKLTGLIRQILSATRSKGVQEGPKEVFKIDEYLQSERTALEQIAKRTESKIELRIDVHDLEITSEKDKISQVIYNLVDNAVKYGAAGQTITVALTQPDKNTFKIEVIDQGKGIAPEMREKLFVKFSQLEPSASRSREGMGLGLYICKQNIDYLGGEIGLQSEVGHGSTFFFTLPIRPPTEGEKTAKKKKTNDKI